MNEEILEKEETTEATTEQPTEATTEATTEAATSWEAVTTADVAEGFYDMSDNPIHELYRTLGVDLDYVPKNKFQVASMAIQAIAGTIIVVVFFKWLWSLVKDFAR